MPAELYGSIAAPGQTTPPVVLVVDDDAPIRDLLASILADEGFHALTACDGAQALRAVTGVTPDVILLDVAMPGISGLEVARRLRSDPATAPIPIVVMSAGETRDQALTIDGCTFVGKPFDLTAMLDTVNEAIARPR